MKPGSFYEMYLLSDLHNVRSEEGMAPAAVKRWWLEKLCNLGDVILFSHCLPHAFTLKQQDSYLRLEFTSQLLKSKLKLKDLCLWPSKSVNWDFQNLSKFFQLSSTSCIVYSIFFCDILSLRQKKGWRKEVVDNISIRPRDFQSCFLCSSSTSSHLLTHSPPSVTLWEELWEYAL